MVAVALFPGRPHFQCLITCSMHIRRWDGNGLGRRLTEQPTVIIAQGYELTLYDLLVPLSDLG